MNLDITQIQVPPHVLFAQLDHLATYKIFIPHRLHAQKVTTKMKQVKPIAKNVSIKLSKQTVQLKLALLTQMVMNLFLEVLLNKSNAPMVLTVQELQLLTKVN